MKFLPGDLYIYDSVHGYQTFLVRSDEGNWIRVPVEKDAGSFGPITDVHIEADLSLYSADDHDRVMFARRGVDIFSDVLLGYADNIQF